MAAIYTIFTYERDGKVPLEADLESIRDRTARVRIMRRIQRMELGNFGDHKSLGEGLWELRIDYGPGYRVYYCLEGVRIVLLLCTGDKRDQQSDIKRAREYKLDYEDKN